MSLGLSTSRKARLTETFVVSSIVMLVLTCGTLSAQRLKTLRAFPGSFGINHGENPNGGLIMDAAGNLYGTTRSSGCPHTEKNCAGTLFELSPGPKGAWQIKYLHIFHVQTHDGQGPNGGLIFDAAGNLYGTTQGSSGGDGTVFELSPSADGSWHESILHTFVRGGDGAEPLAGVIFDNAGNLYGTTSGLTGIGPSTVFELSPNGDGTWTETPLYTFTGGSDGTTPFGGVIFDNSGNLYGTTSAGGLGFGTVFELSPVGDGTWIETTLYTFKGGTQDGAIPMAGLTRDSAGNLYGTTSLAGQSNGGSAFELSQAADGGWIYKTLHFFNFFEGASPAGGVTLDAAGVLWGTSQYGGSDDQGTVWRLSPNANGTWTIHVVAAFGWPATGSTPTGNLLIDAAGNLYGATASGELLGRDSGTVFEIIQ